jgi:hypothetical protein
MASAHLTCSIMWAMRASEVAVGAQGALAGVGGGGR